MTSGFSLLEVILSMFVVSLIMTSMSPALVGAIRTQRNSYSILDTLAVEQAAIAQLREDIIAAPRPSPSNVSFFKVSNSQAKPWRGDILTFVTCGQPPLNPAIAKRAPELGQAVVTWSVQLSSDGRGISWTRSRQGNLLATGNPPDAEPVIMLDHLARLTVEVLTEGIWTSTYDSATEFESLPLAVRITWSYLQPNGDAGPNQTMVIDMPQMESVATDNEGVTPL